MVPYPLLCLGEGRKNHHWHEAITHSHWRGKRGLWCDAWPGNRGCQETTEVHLMGAQYPDQEWPQLTYASQGVTEMPTGNRIKRNIRKVATRGSSGSGSKGTAEAGGMDIEEVGHLQSILSDLLRVPDVQKWWWFIHAQFTKMVKGRLWRFGKQRNAQRMNECCEHSNSEAMTNYVAPQGPRNYTEDSAWEMFQPTLLSGREKQLPGRCSTSDNGTQEKKVDGDFAVLS